MPTAPTKPTSKPTTAQRLQRARTLGYLIADNYASNIVARWYDERGLASRPFIVAYPNRNRWAIEIDFPNCHYHLTPEAATRAQEIADSGKAFPSRCRNFTGRYGGISTGLTAEMIEETCFRLAEVVNDPSNWEDAADPFGPCPAHDYPAYMAPAGELLADL